MKVNLLTLIGEKFRFHNISNQCDSATTPLTRAPCEGQGPSKVYNPVQMLVNAKFPHKIALHDSQNDTSPLMRSFSEPVVQSDNNHSPLPFIEISIPELKFIDTATIY